LYRSTYIVAQHVVQQICNKLKRVESGHNLTFSRASSTLSGQWSLIIVGEMSTSLKSFLSAHIASYVGSTAPQHELHTKKSICEISSVTKIPNFYAVDTKTGFRPGHCRGPRWKELTTILWHALLVA